MDKLPFKKHCKRGDTRVIGRYNNYNWVDVPLDSSNETDEIPKAFNPNQKIYLCFQHSKISYAVYAAMFKINEHLVNQFYHFLLLPYYIFLRKLSDHNSIYLIEPRLS